MDMVQDTYVALMGKLTGFSCDAQAASWLLTVATNRCLNEIRHRRYWRTEEIDEAHVDLDSNPQAAADRRMIFEKVVSAFSETKASVIAAYFLEGMTMEEAASENNVSLPTVRRTVAAFLDRARIVARSQDRGQQ